MRYDVFAIKTYAKYDMLSSKEAQVFENKIKSCDTLEDAIKCADEYDKNTYTDNNSYVSRDVRRKSPLYEYAIIYSRKYRPYGICGTYVVKADN